MNGVEAEMSSSQPSRGVRVVQVYPANTETETETDIDIIAVHGLDTKSPQTWTHWPQQTNGNEPQGVNWLQDAHMLPSVVGRARIFTCDWPAGFFQPGDSVQSSIDELALGLLDGIQRRPSPKSSVGDDRPLLFIASCLGGLILIKALVNANNQRSNHYKIRRATGGVIFLATPFSGTSFQDVAAWAEPGLRLWASCSGQKLSTLTDVVKGPDSDIDRTVAWFTQLCIDPSSAVHVFTFYETRTTRLRVPGTSASSFLSTEKLVSFMYQRYRFPADCL
jgi:hypothetical protein